MYYFLEVAESQHITRSAEKLHIAQPSLTKSINRLEEELGVPLFASKGRNIVLTPYGSFLRDKLRPLIDSIDRIPGELETMAKLENETIHMNVMAASAIVTEAIIEYKKLCKNVSFQLMQQSGEGLYDVGVTTRLFYQVPEGRAKHESVFTEEIFLAVPKNHRLASGSEIKLSEAKDEGFITLLGSKQLRSICDRFCAHAGFEPKIIFESDNPTAVKNMIAANFGVGFWPEHTWGELSSPDVKLMRISDPVCRRDVVIDFRENKKDSEEVRRFYDFLTSYFARRSGKSI